MKGREVQEQSRLDVGFNVRSAVQLRRDNARKPLS